MVGNVVSSLQDGVNKIFNPSYVAGMSDAQQLAFKAIRDRTYGSKNLADQAVKDKGTAFAKTLSKYGDKSEELDKLIVKVIEGGSGEVGELNADVVKIVNQMRADFKAMGMSEHEIGVLRELFEDSDKYFPHVYSWERQMELGAKQTG